MGAEPAAPGFVSQHGLIQFSQYLGRRYSREGWCEICGRATAEIVADYASRYPAGDDRNAHLRVLFFDHCHAHGWVRGLLCLSCNNDMRHYEAFRARGFRNYGGAPLDQSWRDRPFEAHYLHCPECPRSPESFAAPDEPDRRS